MDELSLLRGFRVDDLNTADAVRHQVRLSLASGVKRERRRRRGVIVVLALAVAAILAGGAYAVAHTLTDGSLAPANFREQGAAYFGHFESRSRLERLGEPRWAKARVAASLHGSVGTVYLFSAPNQREGLCGVVWIEGNSNANLSTACGNANVTFYASGPMFFRGQKIQVVYGHVVDGVDRVEIEVEGRTIKVPLIGLEIRGDGRKVTAPLVHQWFLAELPHKPSSVTTYDANGRVLTSRPLP